MKQEFNKKIILGSLLTFGASFASIAKAVCPICVVAIGAGLGLSEWLGVDDAISSLWIGAVLVSMVLLTIIWFRAKGWNFSFHSLVITSAYYLLTFIPLYYAGILGHPLNKIFGTDKIIFGTVIGGLAVLSSNWLNTYLKKKNNGKVFFPYQGVVLPIIILIIISLILWIIT